MKWWNRVYRVGPWLVCEEPGTPRITCDLWFVEPALKSLVG